MRKRFLIVLVISISFFFGCIDEENAEKFLKKEGYKNITFTGYNFFECTINDKESTGFIAERNGKIVEGTVCAGMLLKKYKIKIK